MPPNSAEALAAEFGVSSHTVRNITRRAKEAGQ